MRTPYKRVAMLMKSVFSHPQSSLVTLACMYVQPQEHRACLFSSAHVFMLSF